MKKHIILIPVASVGITVSLLFTCWMVNVNADDTQEKTVEIQDVKVDEKEKKSPTIKVDNDISIEEGNEFKLSEYVSAKDAYGDKLKLNTVGDINVDEVGEQTITVTATDKNGNFSQKEVTVTITPKPTPTPEETIQQPTYQAPSTNNSNVNNNYTTNRNTYTPSYQAPSQPQTPTYQEPSYPSGGSTSYTPQDNTSSSSGGTYASEGACRAAHSTGQCIPFVGADGVTVQGYVWSN